MGIQIRKAKSEEMQKNIRIVKQMTKGMGFDENMGKVNWSFVRVISNFGYQFMPKEKGVKYKKIRLGNVKAVVSEYGQANCKNVIMYIHGGGFVSGSASSSKGYSSMLAKYSSYKVIAVDYSLAPEHSLINSWINNVDAKTSFALAYVAVLIGFVFVNGSPSIFEDIQSVGIDKITACMIIKAIIVILLYGTSFLSIIFMLFAIKARTDNKSGKRSVMFFGTIAGMELNDFKSKTLNMGEKDLTKDLLEQIHTNSTICTKKMKFYNMGMFWLIIATSLCFVSVVFSII